MPKQVEWTKNMDDTLQKLAPEYPYGKNINWAKLVKDPRWRWTVSQYSLRKRYVESFKETPPPARRSHTPKSQPPPSLNFCPQCGASLASYHAALTLNTALSNGLSHD